MKLIFRSRRFLVVAGILVPTVFVGVLAVFSVREQRELSASVHSVTHTIRVQAHIQALGRELLNAETSQRGFMLTTDAAFLTNYQAALQEVSSESNILRRLTADNPIQQSNLDFMGPVISERVSSLARGISLQQQSRRTEALRLIAVGKGQRDSEFIQRTLERMNGEERQLLIQRQDHLSRQFTRTTILALLLLVLVILSGSVVFVLLYRLIKAQAWITVCAWSKTIQYEGEWLTFEQYLSRRFNFKISHGMSPEGTKNFFQTDRPGKEAIK